MCIKKGTDSDLKTEYIKACAEAATNVGEMANGAEQRTLLFFAMDDNEETEESTQKCIAGGIAGRESNLIEMLHQLMTTDKRVRRVVLGAVMAYSMNDMFNPNKN